MRRALPGAVLGIGLSLFLALPGQAQQRNKVWRIGYIEGGSASTRPALMAAFRKKLNDLGYVEGQYEIDARYADGQMNRLGELAASLINAKPDAILAVAPQPAFAIARATPSIPVVFVGVGDPVTTRLVSSLANPGANVTGLSMVAVELTGKRLELLREVRPEVSQLGIIVDPGSSVSALELNEARSIASSLKIASQTFEVRSGGDFEEAFQNFQRTGAHAVFVLSSPLVFPNRARIAESALKSRLPTVCAIREYAVAGCMMSYGPNYVEHFRRAAEMIDRIFKGTKPTEIPVEQPKNYELVVNLKTAKAIGISISEGFLLRADEVIE